MSSKPKFDFKYLYNFTHNLPASSQFLFRPYSNQSILTLTYEGCKAAVQNHAAYYSREDMYDRVLLWRVPLIALWATTTLPSFGLGPQLFTLLHVIADPIDTVWSLLYKLDLAQRTFRGARDHDEGEDRDKDEEDKKVSFVFKSEYTTMENDEEVDEVGLNLRRAAAEQINEMLDKDDSQLFRYFHEVVALITTAYDEWGYGEHATKAMHYGFNMERWTGIERTDFRKMCQDTAFFIASDRVSRFLPSVASGGVFVVQITSAFWKTLNALGDTYDASNPVSAGLNRAPHNIAFGILFFWLPFAVLLTALVGGSQTSHLIPRVLQDFRSNFERHRVIGESATRTAEPEVECTLSGTEAPATGTEARPHPSRAINPSTELHDNEKKSFPDISSGLYERWKWGGLPVWQVEKFKDFWKPAENTPDHRLFAIFAMLLSFSIVAIPATCAVLVSWLTPTQGFECRQMTQLAFLVMWTVNAMVDWTLFRYTSPSTALRSASASTANRDSQSSSNVETHAIRAPYTSIYWMTLVKDLIFTAGTIATLTFSALGMYNQCNCWSNWSFSTRYISFLQDDFIFHMIKHRLGKTFPIIAGCALASEAVLFILIWCYFLKGWRVLKQSDIDSALASRDSRWKRLLRMMKRVWRRLLRAKKRVATVEVIVEDEKSDNSAAVETISLIRPDNEGN